MLTTSIFTSVTFQGYPFLKLSVGQNKDLDAGYGCCIIPHLRQYYWYQRLLWSNGLFVCSIGEASPETIRQYILSQGQLQPLLLTSHRAYRHQWVLRSDL